MEVTVLRALALAAIALVLLGIVGLTSSVSAWHTTHAATGVGAPTAVLRALATAGGMVLVASLLLIWAETPQTRSHKRKRRRPTGDDFEELGASLWTAGKTVAVVLLALAIFCIAAWPLLSRASAPSQTPTGLNPSATPGSLDNNGGKAADSLHLGWLLLPMAVAFAVLTPAAVLIRRRLQRDLEPSSDEPSELGVVRASIAALESEREPRRAILRAYAQMEHAFRNVEVARARDETASEFLARTTRRLPQSAGAAAELTERFEEARFSTHQLTETDRDRALASLRRVEEELKK
jgi:TRAP-type C4-dicarboxylate transport system permease small subunit